MENKIQYFKDQLLMIQECKDQRVKDESLSILMTEMENEFNIPGINDEDYNKCNKAVITLYREISNARQ